MTGVFCVIDFLSSLGYNRITAQSHFNLFSLVMQITCSDVI
jgi:hypothetical protein